ncbi:MAG TPA: PQQ-binding-like beta-propeller repeat protein [Sandaracinaceae bacterium LLY-WYZ-13_1]|nr:PQQ-binding-like beta-propeller repeat protein [Sandaracinaceae bacterium LLY-WYZ-13_1]
MKARSVVAPGVGAAALAAVIGAALPAGAHPVPIGRYAEIPYGIRPDHPHPTDRGGPRRTGRLEGTAPAQQPRRLWERSLRHRRPRGPTVAADGTLYVGTMGGLTALSPDGTERWSVRLGAVQAAPSLAPSEDVVALTRGGLVAMVTPEGVVRRSADLGAPARGSPLVLDDGSVLVSTIDRRVHRLDANLRRVFSVELGDGTASTVSRTRRGALAVAAGSLLTLLDRSGTLRRQVTLGGRATAPAAVADDGTLWVPTVEGILHAVDPGGHVRSRTELGSRHFDGAAPAIGHDGAVRVPTMSEGVICVGPGGTERWRLPNEAGYHAPAAIDAQDTTLVVDRGGRLLAIAADGTERWRVVLGTYSYQAPVLAADGTLYVTTDRGALQAWR